MRLHDRGLLERLCNGFEQFVAVHDRCAPDLAMLQRSGTASADKTARLWDRDSKPLATLKGHTSEVYPAVFAPDGGRILTASSDNTARLWGAFPGPQTLVDRVKIEVPRCLTPEQRQRLFLPPTPPRWCIDMHKWPYDGTSAANP
jgi:WD40 repeat protein